MDLGRPYGRFDLSIEPRNGLLSSILTLRTICSSLDWSPKGLSGAVQLDRTLARVAAPLIALQADVQQAPPMRTFRLFAKSNESGRISELIVGRAQYMDLGNKYLTRLYNPT